jgi:serine phosphatase RsbU (regulator of sigma subunit)
MKLFKFIFFIIGFSLLTTVALGQNKHIELKSTLISSKELTKDLVFDTNQVKKLIELAAETFRVNPDSAILVSQQALIISSEIKYYDGIFSSYGYLGYIYVLQGNSSLAIDYYHESIILAESLTDFKGYKEVIVNAFNSIGFIHNQQNRQDDALRYYQKALETIADDSLNKTRATLMNNIGFIIFGKAKIEADSLDKKELLSEALKYFEESFRIHNYHDVNASGDVLINIGDVYRYMKKYKTALTYYDKSLAIFESIGDKRGLSTVLNNIGNTYFLMEDFKKAEKFYENGFNYAQEIGYPNQIKFASNSLYRINKKFGNYAKALQYHELFKQMDDSLTKKEVLDKDLKKQMQFEFAFQKASDSLENLKQLELSKAEIEKQTLALEAKQREVYYSIGGLGFVLTFALILFNRFQVIKKQKKIINEQKENVELQKQLVEEKNREITDSINYAEHIQQAMLPSLERLNNYVNEYFLLYLPKDIVAGDFYWMYEDSDSQSLLIAAADCTGHGVPGALVSIVCNNALNRAVKEAKLTVPNKILDFTREIVIEEFNRKHTREVKDGMDISLVSLRKIADTESEGILSWSGANNPIWIIKENSQDVIEIKGDSQPIGIHSHATPFSLHEISISKGDTIYLFTDGYADQFGGNTIDAKTKKIKKANFKNLLLSNQHKSLVEQKECISNFFDNWKGTNEQVDDVCVIGLKI